MQLNKTHNVILISIKNNKKIINAQGSKYPIIKEVALECGFSCGSEFYTLYWTDCSLSMKQFRQLPPHIRVNHFPQITVLTRKNKMAQSLNSMLRYFPKEYDFYPQTYLLPMDYATLLKKHTKDKYYIVKPENGCQGKGIFLTNSPSKIEKSDPFIVQRYLSNPLLIDGLKFDLRVYVLITSVNPLRVFMYKDGIARFATQLFQKPNSENESDLFQHLTNYSINKNHQKFSIDQKDFSKGHKRLLSSLFSQEILKFVHKKISEIIIKTIISVLPVLQNGLNLCRKQSNPNSYFQLLGFDIIITQNFKFKLLQVNQNPSLMTETGIDLALKKELLKTVFQVIQSTYFNRSGDEKSETKMSVKDKKQLENCGNFSRIYPCSDIEQTEYYDSFMGKSHEIYREKFGISIFRQSKLLKQSNKIQPLNPTQSYEFYSKQKMARVYCGRNIRTSNKRRLVFY